MPKRSQHHLSLKVCGHTAHVVVDCGQHWDWFPGHINTSEDHCGLRYAGQTDGELLRGQMVQLPVHNTLLYLNTNN